MIKAWKRVKANKGAPGVDNMPIDDFLAFAREQWEAIRLSLLAGTYRPLPVRRVEIPKATGGTRPLGIPTVLDRLIQQAMAQVLLPIFDPQFSESSFRFRPDRSAHGAVYQVRELTTRNLPADRYLGRDEPERPLATLTHAGHPDGHDHASA